MLKICKNCGEEKVLSQFYTNQYMKDGHVNSCKVCDLAYFKARRNDPIVGKKIKERKNARRREKYSLRPAFREKILAENKLYRRENKDKIKEYFRKYNQRPEIKILAVKKAMRWRKDNPEKVKAILKTQRDKLKNTLAYRLNNTMHSGIYENLKENNVTKNGWSWSKLIGYTIKDLKAHLESQFTEGMNWENYGKWHIDHIIPISFFQFTSPDNVEFKMCWRLENLRPLWAKDNMRKSNKIERAA